MNLMTSNQPPQHGRKIQLPYDLVAFGLVTILIGLAGIFLVSSNGAPARAALTWLFALTSDQVTWYLTRAAGIIAYLLLWLSTVWGLVIPSKLFGEVLSGDFTFDFHKFISLLSLGFLGLHIVVLTADRYLPFSVAQLLIPFLSPYRPLWVGFGVVAFYLLLLVTITFYLRRRIGMKAFRYIHYSSLAAYLGAVIHALMSGTDSSLPVVKLLYIGTCSVVVFLTVYWLVRQWYNRPPRIPQTKIVSTKKLTMPKQSGLGISRNKPNVRNYDSL
jgi:predicted ferric reductase